MMQSVVICLLNIAPAAVVFAWVSESPYVARPHLTVAFAASLADDNAETLPDDSNARSVFGTKEYWDDLYNGRGDFSAEEYSWYYGWDQIKKHVTPHLQMADKMLLPGIGNDPIALHLLQAGYKNLVAQDYSRAALERQKSLLSYSKEELADQIVLVQSDVRRLPVEWNNQFDVILEKGLLDAVYLSGDGNIELAVDSLARTLKDGGIFVSISGVVPDELRRELFLRDSWTWIRDGSDDLQAGCFIFQKKV
jgi:SAM-dependent methyltransferase